MHRARRMPKLAELRIREPAAPQSWQQQRDVARMWVMALGGKIVTKPKAETKKDGG